jgi:hypothetical protein
MGLYADPNAVGWSGASKFENFTPATNAIKLSV